MDRKLHKQFKKLDKRENKILNKKENPLLKSRVNPTIDKIQSKIPDKLKNTLEKAFLKGFQLVFEKGNEYIEKTYNKDKIALEYELNNDAIDKKLSKKHVKRLDKRAKHSKGLNAAFSILEGGALGILGIGLPDIPLFISVIMKNIYEIALSYGYDYKKEEEKAYILLIICGAMTEGQRQKEFNEKIDRVGNHIQLYNDTEIDLKEQMEVTARVLSDAMLTAKFIQGIPIVGAVGGIVNYKIIQKIGKYATLKYKRRYLLGKV